VPALVLWIAEESEALLLVVSSFVGVFFADLSVVLTAGLSVDLHGAAEPEPLEELLL
jgi:hypothetical protein